MVIYDIIMYFKLFNHIKKKKKIELLVLIWFYNIVTI